ncbi:MAG: hypothetical protein SPL57_02190 [Lachnospiraceae bacterium]|nr:hypothetical protein [Lachnospiraceae bacterium]
MTTNEIRGELIKLVNRGITSKQSDMIAEEYICGKHMIDGEESTSFIKDSRDFADEYLSDHELYPDLEELYGDSPYWSDIFTEIVNILAVIKSDKEYWQLYGQKPSSKDLREYLYQLIDEGGKAKETEINMESMEIYGQPMLDGMKSRTFILKAKTFAKRHLNDHELYDMLIRDFEEQTYWVHTYNEIIKWLYQIYIDDKYWGYEISL